MIRLSVSLTCCLQQDNSPAVLSFFIDGGNKEKYYKVMSASDQKMQGKSKEEMDEN